MWAELKDIPIVEYSDGIFLDQDWLLFKDAPLAKSFLTGLILTMAEA